MKVYVDDEERFHTEYSVIDERITLPTGIHRVVVQAWDITGQVVNSARTIRVTDAPAEVRCDLTSIRPNISFCGLRPGDRKSGDFRFASIAQADHPITATKLYVDDREVGHYNGSGINMVVPLGPGSHRVVAQSWDGAGNVYKVTAKMFCVAALTEHYCEVISAGNKVLVGNPFQSATYNNPVPVVANAYSEGAQVTHMKVYADGVEVLQTDSNSLSTTVPLASGIHNITVQAWNARGEVFNTVRIFHLR